MTETIKQRYFIEFCQKLDNNKTETIQKIQQAFGDEALSQTQIKEWFNHFKNNQMFSEEWGTLWQAIHKLKLGARFTKV